MRAVHDAAFQRTDEGRIVDRLRAIDRFVPPNLSLVAEIGGRVVGHCLFGSP